MALNGFVSAEDRATRQGFVVAIRRKPQHYQIKRSGLILGFVKKFKHWYADLNGDKTRMGPMGSGARWPKKTRQDAI